MAIRTLLSIEYIKFRKHRKGKVKTISEHLTIHNNPSSCQFTCSILLNVPPNLKPENGAISLEVNFANAARLGIRNSTLNTLADSPWTFVKCLVRMSGLLAQPKAVGNVRAFL